MTDTLHAAARSFCADSPIAYLLELVDQHGDSPSEEEQRQDAEMAAAHHVYGVYGVSLAQVVGADDWQGYPAVTDEGTRHWEASAVAWLDGGLWLHHTLLITEADGAANVLTLIVPCTCGRGYIDIRLETEEHLMEVLSDFRPTAGLSPHDERDPDDCTSITAEPHSRTVDAWR
ncbi:hypothetical protein ABZV34_23840 [Streptomyces sp. NPDC005195]|uniref:hypothetical protein n=1 Tax=Streptomyces sp. NPDC005195 TaxID=3154561 RepID=UPI0033BB3636